MELTIWQLKWCIVNIIQIYFLFLCLFELLHIVLINHLFFRKNEQTMMSKVLFSFTQTGFSTTHETSVTTVQNFYCLFPIFLDPCCTIKLAFFCPTITKPRKDYIYDRRLNSTIRCYKFQVVFFVSCFYLMFVEYR